jgi:O-methyltransferase
MGAFQRLARRVWVRYLRERLPDDPLIRQRVKLAWHIWGYWPLLMRSALSVSERLWLIYRFIVVDWFIPHAHTPIEVSRIVQGLASHRGDGDWMVEAGCWQGGSSAKFSLACGLLGYRLAIFDSFQGVEPIGPEDGGHDFSGEYAAPVHVVREHIARHGVLDVCDIHPGWFADTLKPGAAPRPIRLVYIDCDLARGTREVLNGVAPHLTEDALIFSQDYQVPAVRRVLDDRSTWHALGLDGTRPVVAAGHMAVVRVRHASHQL